MTALAHSIQCCSQSERDSENYFEPLLYGASETSVELGASETSVELGEMKL